MADKKSGTPPSAAAERAMNRVLAAERDAAQAIADCEARARDILHESRQRANRIAVRTNERITLMQMRCAQRIAETLQQLKQAQQAAGEQAGKQLEDARVAECMQQVATALTTGSRGGVNKRDAGK